MPDDRPSPTDSGSDRAASSTSDAEANAHQWPKYGLVLLVATVFLAGIARVVYPNGAALVLMTVMSLFGVGVLLLAVRERLQGE